MSKEAMKLALEALKQIDEAMPFPVAKFAQAALREALSEQPAQQEPVAWIDEYGNAFPLAAKQYSVVGKHWKPLYTTPPQRKPLTVWTEVQHERAYKNSPELHKDVKSLAAFKRVAKAIAAMYGIKE